MKWEGAPGRITRRDVFGLGWAGAAALVMACRLQGKDPMAKDRQGPISSQAGVGRLTARPAARPESTAKPGLHPLELDGRRDGLLYVPTGYRADRPAPLVLMLHGAGGDARGALSPFRAEADAAGLLLLATDSRGQTWDVIRGGYGPDVAFIDQALAQTFSRCAVDPARIAAEGFSDGASYALSIGITNGDLFTHLIAFSPGFMAPATQKRIPRIFVSHGIHDQVLPITACSRKLVPRLQNAGYDVLYREFDGPHTVPPEIAREALDWFLGKRG
jgi:predicted esterase